MRLFCAEHKGICKATCCLLERTASMASRDRSVKWGRQALELNLGPFCRRGAGNVNCCSARNSLLSIGEAGFW